jgi:hypothetical protein
MDPLKVFVSYAHEDEPYKQTLQDHLSALRKEGLIEVWHDRILEPGALFDTEIEERLDKADIVLLLVSRAFLASDYCSSKEASRAVDRAKRGLTKVVPVIVKPCDWLPAPFGSEETKTPLGRFTALPTDGRPIVDRHHWGNEDFAFLDVVEGLRKIVSGVRGRS